MSDTTQEVMVATKGGMVPVQGEVYGLWALTPALNGNLKPDTDYWTFTHVPSGRSYGGVAFAEKPQVRSFVKRLAAEFDGPEWDTADDFGAIPAEERRRLVLWYNDFRHGG